MIEFADFYLNFEHMRQKEYVIMQLSVKEKINGGFIMKKILSLVIVLAMCAALFATAAYADDAN